MRQWYLRVTRFLTRLPRSEWPRCICRGLPCWGPAVAPPRSDSRKLPVVGELGSDSCLSTRIGLRTKPQLPGAPMPAESGASGRSLARLPPPLLPPPPPPPPGYSGSGSGRASSRLRSSMYSSISWSSFTSMSSTCGTGRCF